MARQFDDLGQWADLDAVGRAPAERGEVVDHGLGEVATSDVVLERDIVAARIDALRELPKAEGWGWLTCLRAPAIAKLAADDGPLQMSLFDEQDLAEITHPDYPGERLVACRNPALAEQRARKRTAVPEATETLLAPVITAVAEARLTGAADIGGNCSAAHGIAFGAAARCGHGLRAGEGIEGEAAIRAGMSSTMTTIRLVSAASFRPRVSSPFISPIPRPPPW